MVDKKLVSLLHIVEYGSFTEAARQLSLTQPAISQHIKQLENMYGIRVFSHRMGGTITLTKEGEMLVGYARRMMTISDRMAELLRGSNAQEGLYVVGAAESIENYSIVNALTAYSEAHPDFSFKYVVDDNTSLLRKLDAYKADFIFTDKSPKGNGYKITEVGKDSVVLAVSQKNRLAKKKKATLDEIKKEKLILMLPGAVSRDVFEETLTAQKEKLKAFNVTTEIDRVSAITGMVKKNLGVAVLSSSDIREELKSGEIVALKIDGLKHDRKISLVYRDDFDSPEIAEDIAYIYKQV